MSGVSSRPTPRAQRLDAGADVAGQGDVLDALPAVGVEVLLDLHLVAFLVDRDADRPARGVIAFDCTPVSWPSMSKWRTSRKLNSRS